MKSRVPFSFFVLFAVAAMALRPATAAEPQQLFASDGAANDQFGFEVANARNVVVVGAPYADIEGNSDQGAVYVFVRRGQFWEQSAKLVAADGGAGDNFGRDVDTDGRRIVVGAMRATFDGLQSAGAAYVFERHGHDWKQTAKLTSTVPEENEYFGKSVAIDGSRLAVGALYTTTAFGPRNGSVYLFQEDRPSSEWQFEHRFDSGEDNSYGMYGYEVDVSGNSVIVGMRNWRRAEGAVYFYTFRDDAWLLWWSMMPNIRPCCTYAGKDVAVDDDVVVFSVSGDNLTTGVYRSGLVEVMNRTRNGFGFIQFLEPSTPFYNGGFGKQMAYGSGVIAATNPMLHEVLLFTRNKDGNWTETAKVDTLYPYIMQEHGLSVGEGTLVIGEPRWNVGDNARQGHVLIYDLKDVL